MIQRRRERSNDKADKEESTSYKRQTKPKPPNQAHSHKLPPTSLATPSRHRKSTKKRPVASKRQEITHPSDNHPASHLPTRPTKRTRKPSPLRILTRAPFPLPLPLHTPSSSRPLSVHALAPTNPPIPPSPPPR